MSPEPNASPLPLSQQGGSSNPRVDNASDPANGRPMTTPANALLDIQEDSDKGIVLADGCRLSARVWRPKGAENAPVPVILEYLPYRKRDGTCARDALTHPWFAARGYACVRVDMRGSGDSQGLMEDEYAPQELSDCV